MGTTLYYGPFRRLLPSHIVDSGQLAHNWTSSATPVKIYIGDTLGSYAGTPVPVDGGAVNRFLIGNGGSGSWPANMPPIQNNSNGNYYDSHAYASSIPGHMSCGWSYAPTAYNPSRYTGLMRLAMQAKLGAAKNPDDFVTTTPSNCNPVIDAESHGIIHDEDYYFWQIKISSAGAIATKLKNTAATEWCRANLASGAVTDDKFLVYLLADLTIDTTASTRTLVASSLLNNVYGGRLPMAHGWHYTRQDPWLSSIVTVQEYNDGNDWALEATVATVTMTFTAGLPYGSVAIEQQDAQLFIRVDQPLWYPVTGGFRAYVQPVGKTKPSGAGNGILYCYYDQDGVRVDATWIDIYSGVSESQGYNHDWINGYGEHSFLRIPFSYNGTLGGWTIGDVDHASDIRVNNVTSYEYFYDILYASTDTWDGISLIPPIAYYIDGVPQSTLNDEDVSGTCDKTYVGGNEYEVGQYSKLILTQYTALQSHNQFGLIPHNDAEAIYTGHYTYSTRSESGTKQTFSGRKWKATWTTMEMREQPGMPCPCTADEPVPSAWKVCPLPYGPYNAQYSWYTTGTWGGTILDSESINRNVDVHESEIVLLTSTGRYTCGGEATEWGGIWGASYGTTEIFTATATFSYGGDGYHVNSLTAEDSETIGGYPDMYGEHIDLPIYRLFIGWA